MRIFIVYIVVLSCIFATAPYAFTSEEFPDCGSVSGTVKVWKTKVKTKGPKSGNEVVVYLEEAGGDSFPVVKGLVSMDQKSLIFIPHVLPIQKGTTVKFLNSDTVDHNVYFIFEKTGETLDIGTWGQGMSVDHTFSESGVVITLCKLHLEMASYVVILDNPYYDLAVIDDGTQQASYTIENVPSGKYILKTWHKKLKMKGKQASITVERGKTTTFDITITKNKYAK
jgi:plastocyanin